VLRWFGIHHRCKEKEAVMVNSTSTSTDAGSDERQQTVGPIGLSVMLEGTQVVELEFRADDAVSDDAVAPEHGRPMSYYLYPAENQDEERSYVVPASSTPGSSPAYEYRVTATAYGECWRGGWRSGHGVGPLIVSVPFRHDADVELLELGHR
jgi:hypothetical protein